ncbi:MULTISPECIES: M48 family metallopeptidase [Flavobacteriaceae]|uniref:tetratricopeptide repeat protein n=1 Tax=Flavobacteriaceae TaxID=49546 RepID=UPI0014915A5C|nr:MULTISPECIES: CDC27 family protein [Allomuricauda]MDC6366120.1 tetratricopeptide repeat protein [Muricauda sp. AC10]
MENSYKDISPDQQETFERFLMDVMSETERIDFQQKLESDTELAQKFNDFKTLFRMVEETALRESMDSLHTEMEASGKKEIVPHPKFNLYRIAAGVAILISLGAWFLFRQNPNEKLFNKYFTPDPGLPTVMGTSDNYTFYEAMVDYKQGNYDTAIAKWQGLHQLQASNDTLNYFLGTAFLSNGKADSAIPFLNNTLQYNQSVFHEDALYYLALAYLKEGKTDQAINILESSKDERSKTLLQELTN